MVDQMTRLRRIWLFHIWQNDDIDGVPQDYVLENMPIEPPFRITQVACVCQNDTEPRLNFPEPGTWEVYSLETPDDRGTIQGLILPPAGNPVATDFRLPGRLFRFTLTRRNGAKDGTPLCLSFELEGNEPC